MPLHFLRAWRLKRELKQTQLAERTGMRHSSISRIENGETELREHTIKVLAEALRISPADLFRDPRDKEGTWAIAGLISALPAPTRDTALTMITALTPTVPPDQP